MGIDMLGKNQPSETISKVAPGIKALNMYVKGLFEIIEIDLNEI